jgi:hypothetical protein
MERTCNRLCSAVLAASLLACALPALAAESVRVELNKLEPQDGACRAYLVFENQTGQSFSGLSLDLVMFDQEGIIAKRLAVNAAPLPAAKTSVKLFDIDGLACADIGRILINDAIDCADENGDVPNCVTLIEPSARGDVAFEK